MHSSACAMQHQCGHPNVWPAQSGAWILPVPLGSTRDGVVRPGHCPLSCVHSGGHTQGAEEDLSCFPYLSPKAAAIAVQLRSNVAVCPLQLAAFVCSLMPLGIVRRIGGAGSSSRDPLKPSEDEMGVKACHKLSMQDWLSGR